MILVSNDDGIRSPDMWALAEAMAKVDNVAVVAPDREQSATGTAVTLRQPIRAHSVKSPIADIEAYAVEGTPGDSVILATGKILPDRVSLVAAGINCGHNLGDDIIISGTVSAALQGYLRKFPALAISIAHSDTLNRDRAASLAALIAADIKAGLLPADVFLNINYPEVSPSEVKGILLTFPAHRTHIDDVNEGNDGRRGYFWLARSQLDKQAPEGSDIATIIQGYISISPLNGYLFNQPPVDIAGDYCRQLFVRLTTKPGFFRSV